MWGSDKDLLKQKQKQDLTFSHKMVSNELLLAYSFCVRTREVTNRGLLEFAHLPLSPDAPGAKLMRQEQS